MCEYFLREETSEIVRANFSREYFRKSEYFSEHPIFCEYFWREHFKLFLIKQRVNESFLKVEKARKKKTYALGTFFPIKKRVGRGGISMISWYLVFSLKTAFLTYGQNRRRCGIKVISSVNNKKYLSGVA